VCRPKKGGHLLTKEEYEDCIIKVEFKLPHAGNNGIALRTPLGGHPASDGFEVQVLDSDGYNEDHIKPELKPTIERFRRADAPVTLDGPVQEQLA